MVSFKSLYFLISLKRYKKFLKLFFTKNPKKSYFEYQIANRSIFQIYAKYKRFLYSPLSSCCILYFFEHSHSLILTSKKDNVTYRLQSSARLIDTFLHLTKLFCVFYVIISSGSLRSLTRQRSIWAWVDNNNTVIDKKITYIIDKDVHKIHRRR